MHRSRRNTAEQLALFRRGGVRDGAGRKPAGERALLAHSRRARVTRHTPVLVTTKLVDGLPSLRRERTLALLRDTLAAGSDRFGFRLVEYSIQSNHLHLVAEADDARSLARGVQGLLVRVAKALNRAWERRGKVLSDRYHARILRSPRDVRHALVYVLQNARKHGAQITGIDAFSSGPWFHGWLDRVARNARPIATARSWLLTTGWRLWGLIRTHETPAADAPRKGSWAGEPA